ncbi:hypothetical protein SAMN05880557_112158 [Pseudacidovorax sp. RU35E]|nr:hypothetical protein SAMN05880557_112158 [Pseudacidovorax sp. RU35E]
MSRSARWRRRCIAGTALLARRPRSGRRSDAGCLPVFAVPACMRRRAARAPAGPERWTGTLPDSRCCRCRFNCPGRARWPAAEWARRCVCRVHSSARRRCSGRQWRARGAHEGPRSPGCISRCHAARRDSAHGAVCAAASHADRVQPEREHGARLVPRRCGKRAWCGAREQLGPGPLACFRSGTCGAASLPACRHAGAQAGCGGGASERVHRSAAGADRREGRGGRALARWRGPVAADLDALWAAGRWRTLPAGGRAAGVVRQPLLRSGPRRCRARRRASAVDMVSGMAVRSMAPHGRSQRATKAALGQYTGVRTGSRAAVANDAATSCRYPRRRGKVGLGEQGCQWCRGRVQGRGQEKRVGTSEAVSSVCTRVWRGTPAASCVPGGCPGLRSGGRGA